MGGAVASHGNALPAGEANVAHDPTGASVVVGAAWATPPLLVGLDITHDATLSDAEWAVLDRQANPAAAFLAAPLAFYRRFGSSLTPTGESPCHDLLATMAVVMPDLIDAPVLPLAVVTDPGPAWGATIADRRVPYFARAGRGVRAGAARRVLAVAGGPRRRCRALPGRGPRPVRRLRVSSSSLALAAAFGCAACYGVGSVLEQIGARREETATTLDPRLLIRLAGQLPYLAGLGLDAVGWALSLVALRTLPLFLVQSAVAASIAVTAVVARLVLRTKLDTGDTIAIVVIVVGLIVLALAAAPDDARPVGALFRLLLVAGVPVLAVGAAALVKVEVERGALGLAAVAGLAFSGTAIAGRVVAIPDDLLQIVREPVAWALVGYGAHRDPGVLHRPPARLGHHDQRDAVRRRDRRADPGGPGVPRRPGPSRSVAGHGDRMRRHHRRRGRAGPPLDARGHVRIGRPGHEPDQPDALTRRRST